MDIRLEWQRTKLNSFKAWLITTRGIEETLLTELHDAIFDRNAAVRLTSVETLGSQCFK